LFGPEGGLVSQFDDFVVVLVGCILIKETVLGVVTLAWMVVGI
jgi:hypothetical protein